MSEKSNNEYNTIGGLLSDRHGSLLEQALDAKVDLLEKYRKSHCSGESVTDESVDSLIKIAESVEKNIERRAKLSLAKEKIANDREASINLVNAFTEIHERRINRHQESLSRTEEEILAEATFDPDKGSIDVDLLEGELLEGQDDIDLDGFKAIHGDI